MFQIVKEIWKMLLPRVYIDTHEKNLNVLVSETWLRSVFENWKNYLVKIADFC